MAVHYLEFEKPIADLEAKIEELNLLSATSGSFDAEVEQLRKKAEQLRKKTYANLDPWMKTQVARHPQRPHFVDYREALFTDYVEWSRLLEIGPSKDPRTKASSTSSRMPTSDSEGNVSKIDYSLLKWW